MEAILLQVKEFSLATISTRPPIEEAYLEGDRLRIIYVTGESETAHRFNPALPQSFVIDNMAEMLTGKTSIKGFVCS